jgi:hypothetical protein
MRVPAAGTAGAMGGAACEGIGVSGAGIQQIEWPNKIYSELSFVSTDFRIA